MNTPSAATGARAVQPGSFGPLGATVTDGGVNFAVYSRHAREVSVVLFDSSDGPAVETLPLPARTRHIHHGFIPGVRPGQLYALRADGPFDPGRGLRFNPAKLLVDPYARALTGKPHNRDNALLPYDPASPLRDLSRDDRDSADMMPKCLVVDDAFDWQGDAPPTIPFNRLVVYEVHVKGFTAHPSSRVAAPGTFLGFIEKIPHLVALGVNAVELLPVHEAYTEDFLLERGLSNYWGYNTLAFFAPDSSLGTGAAPGSQVREFKALVRELHAAGIEVILDVVYNHTAEGSELGPTLSLRGLDNPSYYMLTGPPHEPRRYYMNETGCGNSLDLAQPPVLRLVMDSLRYWVEVMHVDGFRFDLASVLGREAGYFRTSSSFFDAVSQDPVLTRVKLIAEPWDLGTYQVGNFPVDWSEWNGRFRDTVRRSIKGDAGQVADFGWRFTGSADLYGDDGRSAYNSVNFVTCHDGFTLWDLVSYDGKHNEANQEHNADGTNDNNSWNCGAEGETEDPAVNRLRRQQARNAVCCLLFAAGTPMLLGGDEFLRTQRGNNNAYCQDNEISWFDWDRAASEQGMTRFVRMAIRLTRRFPILQRSRFFTGRDTAANRIPDIAWFGPDLQAPHWTDPELREVACLLDGEEERMPGQRYVIYAIFNMRHEAQAFRLPDPPAGMSWHRVIDTSLGEPEDFCEEDQEIPIVPADQYLVNARSVVVLAGL